MAPPDPVPLRFAVWGLLAALSERVSVPVRFPVAEGLKATLTVQLAFAGTESPQLLVWAKSPLASTVREVTSTLLLLVTVIACEALEVETVCDE